MAADEALHGISGDVIRSMKQPVLVRIMPKEEITANIGDESNTRTTAGLTPAEQAKTDERRVNVSGIAISEDGEISRASVTEFIASMPQSERAGLLDGGQPNRQAYDRINNLIFRQAFDSDALLRLQSEAVDPEVRTIMSALRIAAPKLARLRGTGVYDIRGLVEEAAETAVNAKRNGEKLNDFIQQTDMARNPEIEPILKMLAENIRSAKKIGEHLSALADLFYNESQRADADMFGPVQKRSRSELMGEMYGDQGRSENARDNGEQGRAEPNDAGAQRADPERSGADGIEQAQTGRPSRQNQEVDSPAFDLSSQTEAEIAASEAAIAAAAKVESDRVAAADKVSADKNKADRTKANVDNMPLVLGQSPQEVNLSAQSGMSDIFSNPPEPDTKPADAAKAKVPPTDAKRSEAAIVGVKDIPSYDTGEALQAAINAQRKANVDAVQGNAAVDVKPSNYGKGNKVFTAEDAEKARQTLRDKLNNLNIGMDPEIFQAGLSLAGYHIEAGARSFAAYSKAMIDDMGDSIRPYLKQFYLAVKFDPRATDIEGMDSAATVEAADMQTLANTGNSANNESDTGSLGGQQNATDDKPGASTLDGVSSEEVRSPESTGGAGVKQGAVRGGKADGAGNGPAGGERNKQPGSLASGQGDIFASETGAGSNGAVGSGGLAGNIPATDFTISEDFDLGAGGETKKFNENVAAIKLLKQLQSEDRLATKKEQSILARYVGWGGLPQAFLKSDGTTRSGWSGRAQELKDILADDEYAAARRSTQDAHYTSKPVVESIYKALDRLGFKKGKMLEPSVGVGNFFGLMPSSMRSNSNLNAVELDAITGGIAKQLYPSANIQSPMGFQDLTLADGTYDVAIGNPPFGSQTIYDSKRKDISKFSIHNYFFGKSIDALREDGILAMVVSKGLMDKQVSKEREHFASKVQLLGAIRLPNTAFKANAGTEVTTDIIFLRKLREGEKADTSWSTTAEHINSKGESFTINKYFADNPSMMLGEMTYEGSMYRANEPALTASKDQDIAAELARAIANLPADIYSQKSTTPRRPEQKPAARSESSNDTERARFVKPNGYYYRGEQILTRSANNSESGNPVFIETGEREDASGNSKPLNPAQKARIKGMVDVGIAVSQLIDAQITGATDSNLSAMRETLNKAYDSFTKKFGLINSTANKSIMRIDPSWPRISALEIAYNKGVSPAVAKSTGQQVRGPSARKADIFSKRTQQPYTPVSKVSSAKEGLMVSLSEKGQLDIDHIAQIYGKDAEAVIKELGDLVYQDPVSGWETSEQYLSGNVKLKLSQAIEAANEDGKYSRNVEALKKVIPEDIPAIDIKVKPGAPWLPPKVVGDFIDYLAGREVNADFTYARGVAKWSVGRYKTTPKLTNEWGASGFDAVELVILASNGKNPAAYMTNADGTRSIDKAATDAAIQKSNEIKAEFDDWIWRNAERRETLGKIYNEAYNTTANRTFDGSHLELPGKVPDSIIKLMPHQKNFIWRVLQGQTTLADHVVGAGKTFAMVGAAMELKRTGLAKKPAIIVPNHLVQQWTNDFLLLYPNANVLAPTKKDFQKSKRKELFARVATGDWDAVIIAHSSFGKLPSDIEQEKNFIKQQIKDLDDSIEELRAGSGKDPRTVKDAEKAKDRLEEKLKELLDSSTKDTDNFNFSELGIDALFVDEAHEFKNLAYQTSQGRLPGLGNPEGAKKSQDLFVKTQSVLSHTGGRNIVFATGTPISNSMVELYTMQRYLGYDELRAKGLAHVDAWINLFGEIVSDFELDSTAQGYKINSRLAKFVNMPELVQMYNRFADSITRDDINDFLKKEGKILPIPKVKGGKPQNIIVPRSNEQSAYMEEIVRRAQNIPADKSIDNMLKITNDARKSALDMRLIDPILEHDEEGKIAAAVDNIKRISDKWKSDKGTQLVFLDLSTPKKSVAKEKAVYENLVRLADQGDEAAIEALDKYSNDDILALEGNFSVYDELKHRLVLAGFTEQEVAFIHDANTDDQKDALFSKVRSGEIRVLLGSTAKMGAGTNVQERLVALHHIDAPWRPSDLEQREGRIIRQGNALYDKYPDFEIEILRYATERTYDSRMWQTIEVKARFIEQMRAGAVDSREIEDIAGEAASAAEMKAVASGNPLILEEFKLRADVAKLSGLKKAHDRKQFGISDNIKALERRIEYLPQSIAGARSDAKRLEDNPFGEPTKENPTGFAITIGDKKYSKREDAGKALIMDIAKFLKSNRPSLDGVGTYRGFSISLDRISANSATMTLVGNREYDIGLPSVDLLIPAGMATRIQNVLGDIPAAEKKLTEALKTAKEDLAETKQSEGAPFKQEQELKQLKDRHKAVLSELSKTDEDKAREKEGPAANGDDPSFSQALTAEEGDKGTTVAIVERTIAKTVEKLGAELDVRVVAKVSDLPRSIRNQIPEGARVKGVYDQDAVYLVAENIKSPRDANVVLAHELVGHKGVLDMLSSEQWGELTKEIDRLEKIKNKTATSIANEVRDRYGDIEGDHYHQEFMGIAAERREKDGAVASLIRKLKEMLRRALSAIGLRGPFSESELDVILSNAETYLRGRRKSEQAAPAFSQEQSQKQTDTDARMKMALDQGFVEDVDSLYEQKREEQGGVGLAGSSASGKNREGNSRSDSNDTRHPQRLYHGTASDISGFIVGHRSRKDLGWLGRGIYLTDRPELASTYANIKSGDAEPNVMPVFARIENPYIATLQDKKKLQSASEDDIEQFTRDLQEKGYDSAILAFSDVKEIVVFEPSNIRSINAAFDPEYRDSPNILFSMDYAQEGALPVDEESEFSVEQKRLREQDKTLWDKAKTVLRRNFAPGGLLPDSVFREKIARDGKLGVVEITIQGLVKELEASVRKDFGIQVRDLGPDDMKALSDALTGKMPANMKERTKTAILAMRQYIDHLSGKYADILKEQMNQLVVNLYEGEIALLREYLEEGRDASDANTPAEKKVAAIAQRASLMQTILNNQGKYVHRSYQVFDDPKWSKKIPDGVQSAAMKYLIERYTEGGYMSRSDARANAERVIDDIIKNDTAYDDIEAFIKESKLGAKDLSVLKTRKDIAPEIRALMGEYVDPRINFAKSATKMGRLIFNQTFLDKVKENGMGVFLFTAENRPTGTVEIAGEASDAYSPLNGLWTFREVNTAFKDSLAKEQMANWYRLVVQFNGMVKGGKTILSPTTSARNFQSAMFFSLANGHFDLTQAKKSLNLVNKFSNPEKLAYVKKMIDLGVIYDNPYAEEMMDLLRESRVDSMFSNSKTAEGIRASWDFARDIYSFGDDFWKVIGFENEKAKLMKYAGMSEAEAEVESADRVRNLYPTYSMVGKAVQWLRRFPVAGTFVSFPAEIIRTTFNMAKTVKKDWETPGMRRIAIDRALGMSMVAGFAFAAQELAKAALGFDDDDEEAIRLQAAPWQKNSNIVVTGRDDEGNLQYFDISFLDPYNYFKRPITAIMRDQPFEDALISGAADMLSPFFGTDIAIGALMEIYSNKKESGGQVFKEADAPADQLIDIAGHLRKALQPGIVSNLERTWMAMEGERSSSGKKYDMGDEGLAWIGWRASTLDPETALYYRTFDFSDAKADASKTLREVLNSPNKVSKQDITKAMERSEKIRAQAYDQMITIVGASERSGMSRPQIIRVLRASNVSQRDIMSLINGRMPPYQPSSQSEAGAIKRAEALIGREAAMQIRDRYRQARNLNR